MERLFHWAALCDKHGGEVQETQLYGTVLRVHEAMGVIGVACPDERPLLAFVSLVAAAVARGSAVVVVPSELHPTPALALYQVCFFLCFYLLLENCTTVLVCVCVRMDVCMYVSMCLHAYNNNFLYRIHTVMKSTTTTTYYHTILYNTNIGTGDIGHSPRSNQHPHRQPRPHHQTSHRTSGRTSNVVWK